MMKLLPSSLFFPYLRSLNFLGIVLGVLAGVCALAFVGVAFFYFINDGVPPSPSSLDDAPYERID